MTQTVQQFPRETIKFNYDDYLLLPDDGNRYEIIEGELFMAPAPSIKHQDNLFELGVRIREFVKKKKLGIVFLSPCDVVLSNTSIIQPDIVFVSKENRGIITEKNIQGAPDLVIEIISPNTAERDLVLKKKLYAKHGVKEYWIVFIKEQKVEVYRLAEQTYILDRLYEKSDILKSPLIAGLKIRLSEVFRELGDYF
ncbi:MAG TPA: Uma2 family endonuclease [bacterium]